MVDRCKIKNQGCLVVDLDGTLLLGNSLKMLTKHLIIKLLKRFHFFEVIKLSYYITIRKMKLIPHKKMKYKIVESAHDNLKRKDINILANILYENRNISVETLLFNNQIAGRRLLLATAAPEFYLEAFVKCFDKLELDFIGTQFTLSYEDFIENHGEEKLKSTESYLKDNNLNCEGIITDHIDDLPLLLKYPQNNYIIKPGTKTLKLLKHYSQIRYIIIN